MVSTEQARAHGLSRTSLSRLIRQGRWRRLDAGLYVARDREPEWLGFAWAGLLLGGDRARLGGRSAGFLHGLDPEPELIEVLIPWDSTRRDRGRWQFTRERADVRSARSVGDPACLTVEDTVLDLLDAGEDAAVVDLVTRAVQSRRTSPEKLLRALERRSRHRHRRLVRRLLGEVAAGAESPLELDFLRDVEQAHGLPTGVRQRVVAARRQDVRYEEFGVVVELDGRLGHTGMGRFRDMNRDNAAAVRGEVPLRFGWDDVHSRPCRTAAQLAHVLAGRGWPGPFSRCSRCRNVSSFDIG